MRDPLHKDQFENFLQNSVNNHRMYPADQLWRSIQKEIHGDVKWPALTYVAIAIITALVIGSFMVKPEERLEKNTVAYPAVITETVSNYNNQNKKQNDQTVAPLQYSYADKVTEQTLQRVAETIVAREEIKHSLAHLTLTKESLMQVNATHAASHEENTIPSFLAKASIKPEVSSPALVLSANNQTAEENSTVYNSGKPASRYFSTLGLIRPDDLKKPSDNNFYPYDEDMWRNYPLFATTDLLRKKLSKFSFQFYVAPSVSYRRLNDSHGKTAQSYTALPANGNYSLNLNRIVEHRPAMGAEVGFALGYRLTPSLTMKGGFQFNMRQYGIRAYSIDRTQQEVTPDNNAGANQSGADNTTNAYLSNADHTSISNTSSVLLYNRYYEIAAPIGLDWRIASSGNGKFSVNAAASLQPTYTFDKEPFVLTTDYKNYTNGVSIMRNWNLNSAVEAYISYKLGAFRWQIGPQFRYQHFSTYSNAYPIREHLLDYGVKVGFTKSLD